MTHPLHYWPSCEDASGQQLIPLERDKKQHFRYFCVVNLFILLRDRIAMTPPWSHYIESPRNIIIQFTSKYIQYMGLAKFLDLGAGRSNHYFRWYVHWADHCYVSLLTQTPRNIVYQINPYSLPTRRWVLGILAIVAWVLKQQAICIHRADKMRLTFDQFHWRIIH